MGRRNGTEGKNGTNRTEWDGGVAGGPHSTQGGVFRTNTFPSSSATSASNALTQILTSPAWRALKWEDSGLGWSYSLDEGYAREMLWKQVENMTNKTGSARSR